MEIKVFWFLCIASYLVCLFCIGSAANDSCTSKSGGSCSDCVNNFDCYYCQATKYCGKRPVIKPDSSECSGDWYSYKQCTVSGNLLLIIVPCVLGALLIIFLLVCYCCCCRKCSRRRAAKRFAKEDERMSREKEEREMKHAERSAERRQKHDEIRKKYGLFKDGEDKDGGKYQRFDVA
ncbi:pituitary tumor-transforming gene 1 protein-interacting protein-like [Rhopilema esculentum]|uniref:pituitary tumor-transforming gene 1 protein-interacting protein-like n=1 Tax=Rhopilema esculentum TaxID=499914 RepID=UPI0031D31523